MAQEIEVLALGPQEYAVRVTEGVDTTDHHVTVPSSLLDELLMDPDDADALVRESFAFLLERVHADEVDHEVNLGQLIDEHEDYLPTMRDVLG